MEAEGGTEQCRHTAMTRGPRGVLLGLSAGHGTQVGQDELDRFPATAISTGPPAAVQELSPTTYIPTCRAAGASQNMHLSGGPSTAHALPAVLLPHFRRVTVGTLDHALHASHLGFSVYVEHPPRPPMQS